MRTLIRERLPKYGNDEPEVDALAADIVGHYFGYLQTQATWRGGVYAGGLSTFNRAPMYGRDLAASADGRRRGEIVADSSGPAYGRDRHGPTAMLLSVARLPQQLACSGLVLNLKLSPALFTSTSAPEESIDRVADLFRTYFHLGGQQLQVNVIDADTLRAAQADPLAHPHVIVRVGGFCARFIDLESSLQDNIIARTAHAV